MMRSSPWFPDGEFARLSESTLSTGVVLKLSNLNDEKCRQVWAQR